MPRAPNPDCGKCGKRRDYNGKRLVCRPCSRARADAWQKANPDRVNARNRKHKRENVHRVRESSRRSKMRTNYGIDIEEYDRLLAHQNGACAICNRFETRRHRDGTLWALSVDHDHGSGMIRGLLCGRCNSGLANFSDSIDRLAQAIRYLNGEYK